MSKGGGTRSRADKGGKSGAAGNVPTPAVIRDIVPGKFSDQDWHSMIDRDGGDEFIKDIVEEVCSSALNIIYQKYIQAQLIPYTVLQAKDAMLEIIEWQFLAHDEGEGNVATDPNWIEDEEPESAVTDCWAQGAVPKSSASVEQRVEALPEVLEEQKEDSKEHDSDLKSDVDEPTEIVDSGVDEDFTAHTTATEEAKDQNPQIDTATTAQDEINHEKLSNASKPPRRKVPISSAKRNSAPPQPSAQDKDSSDQEQSKVKRSVGRPVFLRDFAYDPAGNVVAIAKLNPDRLPNHRVRTGFQVVDPRVEASQARLNAAKSGRNVQTQKPVPPPGKLAQTSQPAALRHQPIHHDVPEDDFNVLPPFIDTMELVPGVVARDGDRIKRGPKLKPSRADSTHRKLRPVVIRADSETISVQDLLQPQPPVIRSLESSPIPPIVPHPPAQRAT